MKTLLLTTFAAALLAAGAPGFAGDEMLDIDTRFRAKIAKEKIKQGARERADDANGKNGDKGECGSQNIGNVDTHGQRGAAPREVFVFAPNAINLVGRGGCR